MTKSFLIALVLIAATAFSSFAQRNFTGTIKYKINYPASAGAMAASLPQNFEMQVAGNKAKFELVLPNGKYTFIINGDETSVTRLIDATEGKFAIKKTKEEFAKGDQPVASPGTETKTIAGYKCKSAEVTVTDRGGKSQKNTVFYSDDLGTNNIYFNTNAKGVKGIMLDMDYTAMGVVMHITATEVNSGRISNKTFEIPADYKAVTEAEFHQIKQASKKK
ncbi:MAG: hypothetical protein HXX13_00240 [Bacteroidetes bacterium]|nr:hypothetical protein [Bacteroidota bacterium]